MKTPGQQYIVKRDGALLLDYLRELYPESSRTSLKNMLSKGQVLVNGQQCTAFDFPLKKGGKITILPKTVSIARATLSNAKDELEAEGVKIYFEDDDYLVVDKPAGLLTVSSARGSKAKGGHKEKTLYAILNAYVKEAARTRRKEDIAAGVRPDRSTAKVWIVHRIDRGTSGVLVFAKNEKAKDILQSRWRDLVGERYYTAILERKVEKESGAVQSYLLENPKSLKMISLPEEAPGAQLAITHYQVLDYIHKGKGIYTLTRFSLTTGRKNQIRVHAAQMGNPVAGDEKYGAQTDPIRRLALHATSLEFRHPFTGKTLRFVSPLPESFERFLQ